MEMLTRVVAVRKLELTAATDNGDAGGICAYLFNVGEAHSQTRCQMNTIACRGGGQ